MSANILDICTKFSYFLPTKFYKKSHFLPTKFQKNIETENVNLLENLYYK